MWFPKSEYLKAYNYAVGESKRLNQCYGIENMPQYGKPGFSVKMVPNNPCKRFGWEMRCEVVTPESPLIAENN
jgi:hypothetical protein